VAVAAHQLHVHRVGTLAAAVLCREQTI
jgi:hypothetical protein